MLRFSNAEECRRACAAAGMTDIRTRILQLVWDVPAPYGLIQAGQTGGVRLVMVLDAQRAECLQRIKEAVRTACQPYERDGRQHVPVAAALTSAVLP